MNSEQNLFKKYLELLEVEEDKSNYDLLCKIVKAHLLKIPFENISKLYYKQTGMYTIPGLSQYLEGIEKYNFGGTCYSNNYYLYILLQYLGFQVKLCGADMKNPDVHLISIVTLDGIEFIIDGGYGAPFFEPLPRDLKNDFIIYNGNEKYILKPQINDGTSKLEQYYNGELKHWYIAKPQPRQQIEFKKVIEDSYSDSAMFMNAILITHFSENGSLVLRNLNLTEIIKGNSFTTQIIFDELPMIIKSKFGMPLDIVSKSIEKLKHLKETWD